MLDRRAFLGLLAGVAAPASGLAQPAAPRIALVVPFVPAEDLAGPEPGSGPVRHFLHTLRELGYVEGRNIVIERHTLGTQIERAPALFAELVRRDVRVLVVGTNALVRDAQRVTSTVPIVMLAADPVDDGLVANLSRPGANVTGVDTLPSAAFSQKWLQLLKEVAPRVTRVAALTGPRARNPRLVERQMRELEAGAREQGLHLLWAEIPTVHTLDERLAALLPQRPDALLVVNSATLFTARHEIIAFATQHRLPSVGPFESFAQDGALMSYGSDVEESWGRMAGYVDRILKGAKPGTLPVQQPNKYTLVVNGKTAKALGLTVPPSLLLRASRVIE